MLTVRQPSKKQIALTIAGIVFSTAASQTVQEGALGPLLATALARSSVRPMWVGVVVGAPSMSIALLSPLGAQLYKSIGPRLGLSIGALVTIACLLSYPLAEDISNWFLLSLIVGFAMALRWVMGETWLIASAPKYLRGRVVGIQEICIGLAGAAGPALVAMTGSSGTTPFFACAGVMAAAGFVPLLVRAAHKPCTDLVSGSEAKAKGLSHTALRLALASAFACGALETGAHSFLPTLVSGKLWEASSPLLAASSIQFRSDSESAAPGRVGRSHRERADTPTDRRFVSGPWMRVDMYNGNQHRLPFHILGRGMHGMLVYTCSAFHRCPVQTDRCQYRQGCDCIYSRRIRWATLYRCNGESNRSISAWLHCTSEWTGPFGRAIFHGSACRLR